MIRTKAQFLAAFLLCAGMAQVYGSEILYTVTDLGTLGGPTSVANAISQNGIICGNAQLSPSRNHPFVYQGSGSIHDLGLLDPVNGVVGDATSVNSQGQIVGFSDAQVPGDPFHAFLYNESGPLIDLGTLGGQQSLAYGINESGQIAGYAQTASGAMHGVLWTVGGATIDLGAGFLGLAINNTGLTGGFSTQTQHAAIYNLSSGSITDLGTFGGTESQVSAMSDTGLVVGEAETPTSTHAFLYDINTGVLTDLGNLSSSAWASEAASVNDLGQVVGGYALDGTYAEGAAFIYNKAGGMQNLNNLIDPSLGWDLTGTGGINDAGEIVGSGYNPQGQFHAFLLTPVPEPSTLQLTITLAAISTTIVAGRLAWARRRAQRQIRLTNTFVSFPFF